MQPSSRWIYGERVVIFDDVNQTFSIRPALLLYNTIIHTLFLDPIIIAEQLKLIPPESIQILPDHVLLSPSFINAHTHLAMCCFRALNVNSATEHNVVEDLFFHVESKMTPEDIAAFAKMGAYESLLHGVGLVWEHYYGGRALAEAIAQTPLTAVVAPTLQDLDGPGKSMCDAQWRATESLIEESPSGIWVALGPHATDTVSDALWRKISNAARTHNVPIHAHVAQSMDEWSRAWHRHQTSPVGMLKSLGVLDGDHPFALIHGIYISQDDLALLDPERHFLGFCPYSQLIFEYPAAAPLWHDQGLPWFVATDCAASNDSMNVQKEMRYVSGMRVNPASSSPQYNDFLEHPSLTNAQAAHGARQTHYEARTSLSDPSNLLRRVWDIPGRMHPGCRSGVIEEGALANFTLWDLDHPSFWPAQDPLRTLALGDTTQAIEQMIIQGESVGTAGDFHRSLVQSDDYQASLEDANRRLARFLL